MSEPYTDIDPHGIPRTFHEDPQSSWERHIRDHGGTPIQHISVTQQEDGSFLATSGKQSAVGRTDLDASGNLQRILSKRNADMEF